MVDSARATRRVSPHMSDIVERLGTVWTPWRQRPEALEAGKPIYRGYGEHDMAALPEKYRSPNGSPTRSRPTVEDYQPVSYQSSAESWAGGGMWSGGKHNAEPASRPRPIGKNLGAVLQAVEKRAVTPPVERRPTVTALTAQPSGALEDIDETHETAAPAAAPLSSVFVVPGTMAVFMEPSTSSASLPTRAMFVASAEEEANQPLMLRRESDVMEEEGIKAAAQVKRTKSSSKVVRDDAWMDKSYAAPPEPFPPKGFEKVLGSCCAISCILLLIFGAVGGPVAQNSPLEGIYKPFHAIDEILVDVVTQNPFSPPLPPSPPPPSPSPPPPSPPPPPLPPPPSPSPPPPSVPPPPPLPPPPSPPPPSPKPKPPPPSPSPVPPLPLPPPSPAPDPPPSPSPPSPPSPPPPPFPPPITCADPEAEATLRGSTLELTFCSCPGAMADADHNGQGTLTTFSMCSLDIQKLLLLNHLLPQDCTPCLQGSDACLKCGVSAKTLAGRRLASGRHDGREYGAPS